MLILGLSPYVGMQQKQGLEGKIFTMDYHKWNLN